MNGDFFWATSHLCIECERQLIMENSTPLCNRPPGINLIRGKFSLGQGAKKELGESKIYQGDIVFLGVF